MVLKIRDSHGRSRLSRTFSRSLLNRVHNYTIPHCHLKKGTYRYFIYATLPDGQKQQRIGSARFIVR